MPDSPTALEIVALVPDLFFAAKIMETARHAGVNVRLAQNPESVFGGATNPAMIILDLHAVGFDPVEFVRETKARAGVSAIPVVAFVGHTRHDLIAAAEAAGCDEVLARSAFTENLGAILGRAATLSNAGE